MRVFVKGFGCSSSLADSEVLAGCLLRDGHTIVDNLHEAELVVYNTCAVKAPTENRMIDLLKKVPKCKKLVVAGCLPLINRDRLSREVRFEAVVGPAFGEGIADVVKQVGNGILIEKLKNATQNMPSLNLPCLRTNSRIDVIPINYGCLGSCAYCCVSHARGVLRSYNAKTIVRRIERGVADGIHEFWLTSQDTACYGRDIDTDLVDLLRNVVTIEGDFFIRVGMMTPSNVLGFLGDLIKVFGDSRVFKFLHLPVQSGDDDILRQMNRFYSVKDFVKIIERFRAAFPQVTIATDIIVGFPGETEEKFQHSLKLIEAVKPDIVNVSKFFARPKTQATNMKPKVSQSVIKDRSKRLANSVRHISLNQNNKWLGWRGRVYIDEKGKPGSVVGRNFAYKPVVIKGIDSQNLLGKFTSIQIIDAFQSHLLGKLT